VQQTVLTVENDGVGATLLDKLGGNTASTELQTSISKLCSIKRSFHIVA